MTDDCAILMRERAALWEEAARLEARRIQIQRRLLEINTVIVATEDVLRERDGETVENGK